MTGIHPTDAGLDLETISEEGKAPEHRLCSAKQAEDIYWLLKDAATPRNNRAAVIQGMFDGNAPYNSQKLRQRGEAWRANFNTLEGTSRKESSKSPYYDLFSSAPMYADCETDVSTDTIPGAEASRIRSEKFDRLLKSYPSFHAAIWQMLDGFIGFGKGYLWWPRHDSWHFECVPWQKVMFPDGTGIDPDKWEIFAIEHIWPVHKLWEFVRNQKAAKAGGWNKEQVIKAIRAAVPKDLADPEEPLQLQQAMKNAELYTSMASRTVQAASIYVREFNGTWSRMMVTTESRTHNPSAGNRPMTPVEASQYQAGKAGTEKRSKLNDDDWLYYKQGVGKNLFEVICPFIYEAEDGSINSLGGIGKRIISVMQVKDRMRCAQVDNVFMGTQIILQSQTAAAHAKQGIVQMGSGTVILPPGYAVQQAGIIGDVERTMAVNNDLDRMLDVNTGTYRPQFEKPSGNPESATAANIRFSQATVLSNSAVMRFYVQADKFYDECYRRATLDLPSLDDPAIKEALEFQKACKEEGLSEKQIKDRKPGLIRAMRAIGNGSPVMRQQTASALSQLVPFLGPRGLDQWKEMFASAFAGQQGVTRLLPKEDRNQVPTRDDYDAVGENADFQTGGQVMFAEWQDHEAHAKTHLSAGVGAIQAVLQGGADPAMPFAFMQSMMPHVGQHIQKISRKNVRDELAAAYQQLAQGFKQIEQAAMEKMKQAQQQQQPPNELQIKAAQMQAEMQMRQQESQMTWQLKQKESQMEQQLAEKQFQQEAALEKQKVDRQTQIEQEKARAQIMTQARTAEAGVQIDQRKAEADIRIEQQKATAQARIEQQKADAQTRIAEQKARQQPVGAK